MTKAVAHIGLLITVVIFATAAFLKWLIFSDNEHHPVDDNDTQGEL